MIKKIITNRDLFKKPKGTSIGRRPMTSSMNKHKRKGRTKKQLRRGA